MARVAVMFIKLQDNIKQSGDAHNSRVNKLEAYLRGEGCGVLASRFRDVSGGVDHFALGTRTTGGFSLALESPAD